MHFGCYELKIMVSLSLYGEDLDPNRATFVLGIQPTHAHRKGDPIDGQEGNYFGEGWWSRASELPLSDDDISSHILSITRKIECSAEDIAKISGFETIGFHVSAQAWGEADESFHSAFDLTPECLYEMNRLGCGLSVRTTILNNREFQKILAGLDQRGTIVKFPTIPLGGANGR